MDQKPEDVSVVNPVADAVSVSADQALTVKPDHEAEAAVSSLVDNYPEFRRQDGGLNMASFTFSLDMKPFKLFCTQEVRKAQRNFSMPGFRKGHVPVALVEKQHLPNFLERYLPSFLRGGFDESVKSYTAERLHFLVDGFRLSTKEDVSDDYQITSALSMPDTLFITAYFELYRTCEYTEEAYTGIQFEKASAALDLHSYHMMVDGVCRTILLPQLKREDRPVEQGDVLFCHLEPQASEGADGTLLFDGKIIPVPLSVSPTALGDELCHALVGQTVGAVVPYEGSFPDTFSFPYLTEGHAWRIHVVEVFSSDKPFVELFTSSLRQNVEQSPLFAKMDTESFDRELSDLTASSASDSMDPHPYMMINSEGLEEGFQAHIDMLLGQLNRQRLLSAAISHLQTVEVSYVPTRLVERYATTFFDFFYAWNRMFGFFGQSLAVFPYARASVASLSGKTHQELLDILKEDVQWFIGKTYFLIHQMLPLLEAKEPSSEDLYGVYTAHHHAFVTPHTLEEFQKEFLKDHGCVAYLQYLYWEGLLREWLLSRVQTVETEPLNSWSLFVMPGFCIL